MVLMLGLTIAAATGALTRHTVHDSFANRDRAILVRTPEGYDPRGRADLLVVFDGPQYVDDIPLPEMLDRLQREKRAPPYVVVLVDNGGGAERIGDLGNSATFAAFVAEGLVPWVRRNYGVTDDPRHTVVAGSSAGGLAAAYVAFTHPGVFGKVLAQSGAFWRGAAGSNAPPYEWLTAQVAAAPRKEIRFVLQVGSGETHATLGGSGPVFIEAHRRFVAALRAKRYTVDAVEVPGGVHSPESWRVSLPKALAAISAP